MPSQDGVVIRGDLMSRRKILCTANAGSSVDHLDHIMMKDKRQGIAMIMRGGDNSMANKHMRR